MYSVNKSQMNTVQAAVLPPCLRPTSPLEIYHHGILMSTGNRWCFVETTMMSPMRVHLGHP